jgi:hypothetical protein
VHDRHGDGAEERRRPEDRGGLHPVRQLERTTSPAVTPRSRSPAASRRAVSSTSRKVPDHGLCAECTRNSVPGAAASPRASRSPSVSRVHQPAALYRFARSAGTDRIVSCHLPFGIFLSRHPGN